MLKLQNFNRTASQLSETIQAIEKAYNTGNDKGLIISTTDKKPATKWKNEDKTIAKFTPGDNFWNRQDLDKAGLTYDTKNTHGFIVMDWDQIDEYNLETIRYFVEEYKDDGLLVYPTRNGAHMWFAFPEGNEDLEKWQKRQTGITSFLGNEKIDYLPNGIINFGLKSAKTGKIEFMAELDKFNNGELQKDVVKLLKELNVKPHFNLNELPELPVMLYPIGKTADYKLDMSGSRNVGLTSWMNKLNFYSPKLNIKPFLEDIKEYINDVYLGADGLSNEELGAITIYENESMTNQFYMSKGTKKAKENAVKTGNTYNSEWNTGFGEIANIDKKNINDIVYWVIDNMEIKLYDKVILFRKNDKWHANPNILLAEINRLKLSDHLKTSDLNEIYKKIVWELESKIAEGQFEWNVKVNKRPLWVDRKGRMIDPKNVWVDGKLNIQEDIADGIILHQLDIDFENINAIFTTKGADYGTEQEQFKRYIVMPLMNDRARYNHFLSSLGYTLLSGSKFRKESMMVYSEEADSGKSKMLEMLASFYPQQHISRAKLAEMSGSHGLQALMNKAVNVGDDIDGNARTNTEVFKTLSSEMFAQVNPKGLPQTNALMPKLAFSMNSLPTARNIDHGWIRRLNIIHWEKNYTTADYDIEKNITQEKFRNIVFAAVLKRFADYNDTDFWNNPNGYMIDDYVEEAKDMNEQIIEGYIAQFGLDRIVGKTQLKILEEIKLWNEMFRPDKINGKKFGKIMKDFGLINKRKRSEVSKNMITIWTKETK